MRQKNCNQSNQVNQSSIIEIKENDSRWYQNKNRWMNEWMNDSIGDENDYDDRIYVNR